MTLSTSWDLQPGEVNLRLFWIGLAGYVGHDDTGLEFSRHRSHCTPGKWVVGITGWGGWCDAVVDDFGRLVKVPRPARWWETP